MNSMGIIKILQKMRSKMMKKMRKFDFHQVMKKERREENEKEVR